MVEVCRPTCLARSNISFGVKTFLEVPNDEARGLRFANQVLPGPQLGGGLRLGLEATCQAFHKARSVRVTLVVKIGIRVLVFLIRTLEI